MIEGIRKVQRMREIVKSELEDIPRGDLPQNMLRQVYSALRMHSLGSKAVDVKTKEDAFKKAVKIIKKDYPNFAVVCKASSDFHKKGLCDKTE